MDADAATHQPANGAIAATCTPDPPPPPTRPSTNMTMNADQEWCARSHQAVLTLPPHVAGPEGLAKQPAAADLLAAPPSPAIGATAHADRDRAMAEATVHVEQAGDHTAADVDMRLFRDDQTDDHASSLAALDFAAAFAAFDRDAAGAAVPVPDLDTTSRSADHAGMIEEPTHEPMPTDPHSDQQPPSSICPAQLSMVPAAPITITTATTPPALASNVEDANLRILALVAVFCDQVAHPTRAIYSRTQSLPLSPTTATTLASHLAALITTPTALARRLRVFALTHHQPHAAPTTKADARAVLGPDTTTATLTARLLPLLDPAFTAAFPITVAGGRVACPVDAIPPLFERTADGAMLKWIDLPTRHAAAVWWLYPDLDDEIPPPPPTTEPRSVVVPAGVAALRAEGTTSPLSSVHPEGEDEDEHADNESESDSESEGDDGNDDDRPSKRRKLVSPTTTRPPATTTSAKYPTCPQCGTTPRSPLRRDRDGNLVCNGCRLRAVRRREREAAPCRRDESAPVHDVRDGDDIVVAPQRCGTTDM
ncbi:hypothetical protein AMAG_19262 [Allomyces macrogynus ATCC 38327]|uniref:GATA-type domain-containing protein n=1 Tax=Allomyces macrogynus (strain ATCC 38327) TaxID=578462 RepID=A0A0L0SQN9_ALLM3|nr:hypothetical protein AMAG_19262 [Allomyces macrogynus ATCC 38327]|eukprot:KNE64694.1 hypothetical protein AMAG_19262 [Allomyces macrogynus ATCC 38327]